MQICAACHAPVAGGPDPPPSLIVFTCCDEALCSRCIAPAITTIVAKHLWSNLGQDTWLKCPMSSCHGHLSFETAYQLMNFYLDVGATHDAFMHVRMFARAVALRKKLAEATQGMMGRIQGEVARTLHERLVAAGVMAGVFSDLGSAEEIEVDSADVRPLEGSKRMVRVPIITSLFKRKTESRTCSICMEDLREVDIPNRVMWERTIEMRYQSDLDRFLDPFPTADELPSCAAAHVLDICKQCISQHISSKLEDQGVAVVSVLQCPSYECGLIYTPRDIQAVANQTALDNYQRLCLTKALADEPTFRWCLNPNCSSGALYDTSPEYCDPSSRTTHAVSAGVLRSLPPEARAPERIVCNDCNFAMCFTHGTPWHRGLTCPEYTALEARGDAACSNASWMARNTKKCPGPNCGVTIEKGNLCFHMTCAKCRFEFCWECLAPWKGIFPREGYRVEGHREGCFFKSQEAPRPMLLAGETVVDAVGAMEARAAEARVRR